MRRIFAASLLAAFLAAPALAEDPPAPFTLSVGDLAEGARIPDQHVFDGFGCAGGNISPEISWSGAPEGTKSFALIMYDPDAPSVSGFWHWMVLDIPGSATGIPEGAGGPESGELPEGARQGYTDFGPPAYGGPCPPVGHGIHRYQFTLYALGAEKLPDFAGATGGLTGFLLNAENLGQARRTLVYSR